MDERANIVQTRHKVFAILGEASASSPSNKTLFSKSYEYDIWNGANIEDLNVTTAV